MRTFAEYGITLSSSDFFLLRVSQLFTALKCQHSCSELPTSTYCLVDWFCLLSVELINWDFTKKKISANTCFVICDIRTLEF